MGYNKKVLLFWIKIANSEMLSIIRNSLTLSFPVIIAGTMAFLINFFPVEAYQLAMTEFFGPGWQEFGSIVWGGTLAVVSTVMAFTIGYSIVERFNLKNPMTVVHPVIAGFLSYSSLLIITESTEGGTSLLWAGTSGLFPAIITGFASSRLFLFFYRKKGLRLKFHSGEAGSAVSHAFTSLIPAMLTLGTFAGIKVLMGAFGISDIHAFFYKLAALPFTGLENNLGSAMLYSFARQVLWFFGIHGSRVLDPVAVELLTITPQAELAAGAVNITKSFFSTYVLLGGTGNALSLLLVIFITQRENGTKWIARASLLPAIFNINEPLLFGLPIVMNPLLFIPFVTVPMLSVLTAWLASAAGFLPRIAAPVFWTTPALISGYMASGSLAGCVIQIINILLGFFVYLPFVRLYARVKRYNMELQYGELLRAGSESGEAYKTITEIPGETAAISQVLANDLLASMKQNEGTLLRYTPSITFMLDPELNFLYGSEKTVEFLEFSDLREMAGIPFRKLFSRTMPETWISHLETCCLHVIDTGKSENYEETVNFQGKRAVYQMGINAAEDLGHCCRGVVVNMNDVSELFHAREEAEQASIAKGSFLANMSHEMRTPMNAIIGMTSIAIASGNIDRKNYCLKKIDDASTHLLGVINDILDMSKIEANKMELSPVNFNFEKMLQKVVTVINFRVGEKNQEFIVHIDEKIPRTILGDNQRIAQVITNLLSNAVKFTPERGTISLDTRLLADDSAGKHCTIQFEVKDTGIGITPEQRSRLFNAFEQAENVTSRKFGGTGLGLAISKRIVEMMGGRIWLESKTGKGSTFAFTIQVERVDEELHPSLLKDRVNWHNMRLLVVDDHPEIGEYFEHITRQYGISCDFTTDGGKALGLIREKGPYDIYFIDWKMPDMDGIELSRQIKQFKNKETDAEKSVVIMISAGEWSGIAVEAKAAGVDKFLSKPLFPSTIIGCLNDCLGTAGLDTEGQALPGEMAGKRSSASLPGLENFEGFKVLLAEDVEINQEILINLLEPSHVEIDCASNGAEALRMFSEKPDMYDLIFMDVQMPEMDGYEATRRIRAMNSPKAKRIPIIAMTANVFREDIEKCLESGMNDHVGKPLDINEVMDKLHKYIKAGQEVQAENY
jgi:lactose/cellobiose-specific phosphotransferase system IIC component